MHVKRFEASDMQEALRLIKHELGPDAIILSSRQIKKGGGVFGMFGRSVVEVTAAAERETVASPAPRVAPSPSQVAQAYGAPVTSPAIPAAMPDMAQLLDPLQRDVDQMKELLQQLTMKERFASYVNVPSLEREFSTVRKMVEMLVQKQQDSTTPLFNQTIMPCYQRLLASGMDEDLARRLMEQMQNSIASDKLHDMSYVQQYCASLLMKAAPMDGPFQLVPGEPFVAAFVGPTGVGKTTTIAKLAAQYVLSEKRKVALLTLDTYRIAAVEQLRIYAKIIGLPVDIALNANELEQLLIRHQEKDVVLIDTAGRSQRDTVQMAELAAFFGRDKRAGVHPVLSATSSPQNLSDTVERFKPLNLASLVFTKLDESTAFDSMLSTALKAQVPLSYFTTGQRVPEDIEVATPERVVDLILNVSQWHNDARITERG